MSKVSELKAKFEAPPAPSPAPAPAAAHVGGKAPFLQASAAPAPAPAPAPAVPAPAPPSSANEATDDLPNGIIVKNIPEGASANILFWLNVCVGFEFVSRNFSLSRVRSTFVFEYVHAIDNIDLFRPFPLFFRIIARLTTAAFRIFSHTGICASAAPQQDGCARARHSWEKARLHLLGQCPKAMSGDM
jgi:hypothetical protein